MVGGVAAVQVLNFSVVVFSGVPLPPMFTVGQVVDALRGDVSAGRQFTIVRRLAVASSEPTARGEHLRLLVASALGLPPDRVRLQLAGPQPSLIKTSQADLRNALLIGDFVVSVRRADDMWLSVSAASPDEQTWRSRALLWLILSLTAILPFAWALSRRVARPIAAFSAAADRLGRDPHAAPMVLNGPPEVTHAALAFNKMQSRLNLYVNDRTILIGSIAHDLRTPLMRLALRLEGVPDHLRDAAERDIREMESMIAASTAFVRGLIQQPERRRPLQLRSLIESLTDDLIDRNEQVTFAAGADVVIDGDPVGLKTLLANLIHNALRYAGMADVALHRSEGHVTIEVSDRGPGIADEDLDRLFEPFFRGEKSRNRDTGGVGLGLASARSVARAHGGDITITNRVGGGVVATVILPQ